MMVCSVGGLRAEVFPAAAAAPMICLSSNEDEREALRAELADAPAHTLVCVTGLNWERDLSPWPAPAIGGRGPAFAGGADAYLRLLTERILPAAEAVLPAPPLWRGIAGYSLAGLFALYALCRTDAFSRAASMSGSLWYPGLRENIAAHAPARRPDCLYVSLGDREERTRNPVLSSVRRETEAVVALFRAWGVPTALEFPPGNHFQDVAKRTARGVRWLLEN